MARCNRYETALVAQQALFVGRTVGLAHCCVVTGKAVDLVRCCVVMNTQADPAHCRAEATDTGSSGYYPESQWSLCAATCWVFERLP